MQAIASFSAPLSQKRNRTEKRKEMCVATDQARESEGRIACLENRATLSLSRTNYFDATQARRTVEKTIGEGTNLRIHVPQELNLTDRSHGLQFQVGEQLDFSTAFHLHRFWSSVLPVS